MMWNAIQFVSGGLTLVSFVAAVTSWLYWKQILQKRELILTAPEQKRPELVLAALEFFNVDTANLTKQQQFDLAIEQIRARATRFMISSIIVTVIAALAAAVMVFAISRAAQPAPHKTAVVVHDSQVAVVGDVNGNVVTTINQGVTETQIGALTRAIRESGSMSLSSQIKKAAETQIEAIDRSQPNWPEKVIEVQKRRDIQLSRVDEFTNMIMEELNDNPSEGLRLAVEIAIDTKNGGIDSAIAYLEKRRPATRDMIRRYVDLIDLDRERRNHHLHELSLTASLQESKLEWSKALESRQDIVKLAPDWFDGRVKLGQLLTELGDYEQANVHLREACRIASNTKENAIALTSLADLLQKTDPNDLRGEVESLLQQALTTSAKAFGTNSVEFSTRQNNLATLFSTTGRRKDAEHYFRRALAIRESALAPDHPAVAEVLNNLALLLKKTQRPMYAEPLYRRALEIDEKSHGSEDRRVATRLSNLAKLLEDTDRPKQAEPLLRRALAIAERTFGPTHPTVALRLNNLGNLYRQSKNFQAAEVLMRRAIEIDECRLGPTHPDVVTDLVSLATLLNDTSRTNEARLLFRRILSVSMKSLPDEHAVIAQDLSNLAGCLQSTESRQAMVLMRHALVIDEKIHGPQATQVAIRLHALAKIAHSMGRPSDAEVFSERSVRIFALYAKSTGNQHPFHRSAVARYSDVLKSINMSQEQIENRLKAAAAEVGSMEPIVPAVERLLGPNDMVTEVLKELDSQYQAEGRFADSLSPDTNISPHLDQLLGTLPLGISLSESITTHLDQLLGPAKPVEQVLNELSTTSRQQSEVSLWECSLEAPISPRLNDILGPLPEWTNNRSKEVSKLP